MSTTIRPCSALILVAVLGALASACAEEPPPPRIIPGPARDRILSPTPAPTAPAVVGELASVYVVQPGDTVALLAARFGSSIEVIVAANNIADPARLEVGRELMIPGGFILAGAPDAALAAAEVARPPVLPHAKAPPAPEPDRLEVLYQAVIQSPVLPYAGIVGGVAVLGMLVHLLALLLHELRLALAGVPQLAVARVGGARQRAAATRSASSHALGVLAPPVRLLARGVGFATRPLHPTLRQARTAAFERIQPRVESVRAHLPQGERDEAGEEDRAARSMRGGIASLRRQAAPALQDLWVRALTFAAHRSRFAAAMPYVRRYAGTSGLAWGMSGRVAAPTRIATAPTAHEIEASLAAGDLAVHFRPVFRVGGGLAGAVAVLRWRHPLRGWTAADRIVESPNPGDAGPQLLLRLLLTEACRFAGAWRRSDAAFRVTLPLSRSQLGDPELPALVTTELARVQLRADALEFEVTERAAAANVEQTAAVFRRLRDLGAALALDDFAGVLAEEELEALAPDGVKIDFWGSARNPNARSAVADAVRTAQPFGVEVTAKRVETPDEVDLLRELDCTFTWGDAFAEPVPADRFAQAAGGVT